MPISTSNPALRRKIAEQASALGFDAVGFADARAPWDAADRLATFLANGFHGDMGWMAIHAARRAHPTALWADARSAIVLGLNYGPDHDPLPRRAIAEQPLISVYALGADYHDLIKKRLKSLGRWLANTSGCNLKVFVDTAPLMEKPLAARAGLGWQGKHTNLVNLSFGSWLFLGVILTDLELDPDPAETDHCGTCSYCIDICPTKAFPAPYQLDARRCISYLTIEHPGPIDPEFRKPMGNHIYGCDDCLAVCPWNKFATQTSEIAFAPRHSLGFAQLLAMDDETFRFAFAKSPIKRIGRNRFVRNVLIAAGNSGDRALTGPIANLLDDPSPLVRGMSIWALGEIDLAKAKAARAEKQTHESDQDVLLEWDRLG